MVRLIKRYENRKMYDTEASAYVSLSDIAELVRGGSTVQVIDNSTGADLTAQTLTQIILEEGKKGESVIPADLLHDLLRKSGHAFDSGIEQLKHGVDDLVQGSLQRLNQLIPQSKTNELAQLKDQLGNLEEMLGRILNESNAEASAPIADTPIKTKRESHEQEK